MDGDCEASLVFTLTDQPAKHLCHIDPAHPVLLDMSSSRVFPVFFSCVLFLIARFHSHLQLFSKLSSNQPLSDLLFHCLPLSPVLPSVELFMPRSSSSVIMSVVQCIPHPYDELDRSARRWMRWVKERDEKWMCFGRGHFLHSTSVHWSWPEGTRH